MNKPKTVKIHEKRTRLSDTECSNYYTSKGFKFPTVNNSEKSFSKITVRILHVNLGNYIRDRR